MKKGWKCICTIGGVAALCAGASFVKDYRNMKRMEKRLDSLEETVTAHELYIVRKAAAQG